MFSNSLMLEGSLVSSSLNSNYSMRMFTFHAFFVIWFRARTRVRWVAYVISVFLLG